MHIMSRTAIWVAAARAIGAREPDATVRNPDHLAERLLGNPAELELDHPVVTGLSSSYEAAMQDIEVAGVVRSMIERTRFIDAALQRAVAQGATQVLIPGAGLDSHGYRFAELLRHTRIYEVDRPVTQAFKQRRVTTEFGGPPLNLVYVPLDLQRQSLPAALAAHGYDPAQRTFVILEGLSMYVTEEALRATLQFIATHAKGSSVVFDFATRAMIDGLRLIDMEKIPPAARPALERFLKLLEHEPWMFGIPLDTEREFLASVGLTLGEMLTVGSDESVARYLTRADGTTVGHDATARTEAMRKAVQESMAPQDPEQRAKFEASLREQVRQNAYRIAEAMVG